MKKMTKLACFILLGVILFTCIDRGFIIGLEPAFIFL